VPNATLSFLPWVRQGAAAAITTADTPTTAAQPAVATVTAAIALNGAAVPAPSIKLRGPADVIGIDTNQVVRTDPHPGTIDFEPNCFPSIEFDRPDFPWLFTPAKANDARRLRPWLCLVVVQKQAGVTVSANVDARMAALTIATPAKPSVELPDLKDSWAWAHAQVAADGVTPSAIDFAFAGGPELTVSRLVCPRVLAPNTEYVACVVPTFEVGRRTGLGIAVSDVDLGKIALAPAWVTTPTLAKVELPVFYQWEFRTGQQGNFESIARGLTSAVPEGLGKRSIDISSPCFNAGGATTVALEGALIPIPSTTNPPPPEPDPIPLAFKNTLASIVNEPARVQAIDPNSDPLLAPPIYGRWHAAKATAEPTGATWLDQLNLDPRWRTTAAFGTRVVQEHKEALMASAWEQAAEIQAANQRLRQVQMSIAVGEVLHKRTLSVLSEEMVLRFAAPAFARLRHPLGRSMLGNQSGSKLPAGANRSAMRRIGRLRGPLTRRTARAGFPRSDTNTWVTRLNEMVPPPQYVIPLPPPADIVPLPSIGLPPDGQSLYGAFFVAANNTAPVQQGPAVVDTSAIEAPDFFRSAAQEHLSRVFPPRAIIFRPHFIVLSTYESVKQAVLDQMRPRVALPAIVGAEIAKGGRALKSTAAGVPAIGAEIVMAPPYFPQPMFEPLRDISQDLLIPGLDTVNPETVLGLRTNRRFVESYMVGLNHEMGRELLWRGYPTDQRGTYFDRFWGQGVPNSAPKDITDLNSWSVPDPRTGRLRALGDPQGAPANSEEFVLLLRSVLLKRYPNAVIYMTPAIVAGPANPHAFVPDLVAANEVRPIFSGSLKPDVVFLGFPVTARNAVGGPGVGNGYFVIIQEHPTEARFGIDVGITLGGASHLVIGPSAPDGLDLQGGKWNTHAADMARVTRRLPARVAIHASRLITPA
jgi:hypothetical protein